MKKHERKIENRIIRALNSVCDALAVDSVGFCWLTHFVDNANVPQSLRIVCVFDTDLSLANARNNGMTQIIPGLAETHLEKEGFVVPYIEKIVFFDTEENGANVNRTSWCRKYRYKS